MASILKFFKTIKNSIYSPEFYWRLHKKPFSYSMKYFWILIAFTSLLITAILSPALILSEKAFIEKTFPSFVSKFPETLIVTVQNGEATTNQNDPVSFAIPDDNDKSQELKNQGIENILVIDASKEFTISKFEEAKTLILLSKNALTFGTKNDYRIRSLKEMHVDTKIDKNTLASFGEKLQGKTTWIYIVTVVGLWLAILIYLSLKLISFFFIAWIIGLLLRGKKHELTYKKLYQISLHAATLGIILEMFHFVFLPSVPFLFSIITIMVALANFTPEKLEKQKEE